METVRWPHTIQQNDISTVDNNGPAARYGHTAVIWKDSMFVFGGTIQGKNIEETAIWIYRFAQNAWFSTPTGGATIPGRHGHSAVVYHNSIDFWGCG